jgi:hypothetical protein
MTPCLAALFKQVIELCGTGLRSYHHAKEFTLQQIRPLGHREKLAYECPRLADPSRDPVDSKILTYFIAAASLLL